jgi:hypothetical protein
VKRALTALVFVTLCSATTARAAEDPARKAYAEGVALYAAGKIQDAERKLLEAWSLKQTHDVATNLGDAEEALGKLPEAATYYRVGLKLFPVGGSPGVRAEIQKRFDKVRAKVGAVRVSVDVAHAEVRIDDKVIGPSPIDDEVFVKPGTHSVAAQLEGYKPASASVSTVEGGSGQATLHLEKLPPSRNHVPAALLGGAAVATGIVGVVLVAVAAGQSSDANALHDGLTADNKSCVVGAGNYDASRCASLDSAAGSLHSTRTTSAFVFAGAGALAVASVVSFFFWPLPDDSSAPHARVTWPRSAGLRIVPSMTPDLRGVVISNSF